MLFLDIETQNSFKDVDHSLAGLKISYVGAIDMNTRKEYDFWESDLDALGKLLREAEIVVGYNIFTFDMPIIANYLGQEMNDLPMLDLMVAVTKKIGFRPKLDHLASATLGRTKTGSGFDAIKYYANGELDKLKSYCLEDVRLTLELYEYGLKNGTVKYLDKNGFVKETEVDWELGKRVPSKKEELEDQTISMF